MIRGWVFSYIYTNLFLTGTSLSIPNQSTVQVLSFLEGLQRDLVAVLPTGTGKTLIACLLLKQFRKLNPERMGLFLVDRIPLVFQQKKVIRQKDNALAELN